MTPLGKLLPFETALERSLAAVAPVRRSETLPLSRAAGRALAEDVASAVAIPGAPRAAMDGYAFRAGGGRSFRVIGFLPAGKVWRKMVPAGAAVEIATGAVVPAGCDAMIAFERVRRIGDRILFADPVARGHDVIPAGSDVRRGERLLAAGDLLIPARLGAAAAAGRAKVRVREKPRVAILTTGDEIRPPGTRLAPHQVYDSNARILAAIAERSGCRVSARAHLADDPDAIGSALDRLLAGKNPPDAAVFTGGSSVGNRDFTHALLAARGRLLFRGIRVKPGRPTLVARTRRGALLVGMPGYPASCLLVGHALLAPVFRRMAGLAAAAPTVRARLARDVASAAGRTDFCPVRLADGTATPTFRGSYAVSSIAPADGFFTIPETVPGLRKGQTVDVELF